MDTLYDSHSPPPMDKTGTVLDRWLDLLEAAISYRVAQVLGDIPPHLPLIETYPAPQADGTPFAAFVARHALPPDETLLLTIALAPLVRPALFDRAVHAASAGGGGFEALGGQRGRQHRGVLPTGDTALFILAGSGTTARLAWQARLTGDSALVAAGHVRLAPAPDDEPPMAGRLMLDPDTAELLLTGGHRPPATSARFPAKRIETLQDWEDLILPGPTMARIVELRAWIDHGATLMVDWRMRNRLRPGCRALFYGPPGTGKTLTAALLGKVTGRPVFRVDLSMVVSKYIGETEKNLATIFDKAENKGWILFFDEADALFGKRAPVRDARDRYANQEVSFLLQRIEEFDGLVILASNLAGNVDVAFARRFEQMIHFPMPRARERLELWRRGLPSAATLEPGFDLTQLANQHELSGGTMMNVIRHACLQALSRGETVLRRTDIEEGVRREFAKEHRLQ